MTEAQADQIIDYISGMLKPPDPIGTRKAWRAQLASLDPEVASRAAINGVQEWKFFPSWPLFYGEYRGLIRKAKQANPDVACTTCRGDRFVLVQMRTPEATDWQQKRGHVPPEGLYYEEYAPCPDCNSGANTSFRRADGLEVVCPDPDTVRRMMAS